MTTTLKCNLFSACAWSLNAGSWIYRDWHYSFIGLGLAALNVYVVIREVKKLAQVNNEEN